MHQKRADRAEKDLAELKNHRKRAEDTVEALNEVRNEIRAILDADNEELKKRCHDEEIRIFGGAAMKHKYACALLKNDIEK
jgi:hypothetical protein